MTGHRPWAPRPAGRFATELPRKDHPMPPKDRIVAVEPGRNGGMPLLPSAPIVLAVSVPEVRML